MAKYKRTTVYDTITTSDKWHIKECSGWSIFNAGNVNVTIDDVLVLKPRETFRGPVENPDVEDDYMVRINFDKVTVPTMVTPVGGETPTYQNVVPGGPPPAKDARVIIIRNILKAV